MKRALLILTLAAGLLVSAPLAGTARELHGTKLRSGETARYTTHRVFAPRDDVWVTVTVNGVDPLVSTHGPHLAQWVTQDGEVMISVRSTSRRGPDYVRIANLRSATAHVTVEFRWGS